jgi:AcrR family transcriptional regulator
MPKETFLNLDTSKRDKIIKAAKEEFTKYQIHKARVSNIIKTANIPRGSFYQYFEDLEDLYFFVIDELFDEIFDHGIETSKRTEDIFDFAMITFDFDYDGYKNDKRHQFMMNVVKSIGGNIEYIEKFNQKRLNYVKQIIAKMDMSKIRLNKQEDQLKMYFMIQDLKRSVIGKSMLDKTTKEEAKKDLAWYLDILKNGLLEETK